MIVTAGLLSIAVRGLGWAVKMLMEKARLVYEATSTCFDFFYENPEIVRPAARADSAPLRPTITHRQHTIQRER